MNNTRERAEAGTRARMSEADRRKFSGIAKHPLARKWMYRRLIEAQEKAEAATDATTRERWQAEVQRVNGELRRLGVNLEDGK